MSLTRRELLGRGAGFLVALHLPGCAGSRGHGFPRAAPGPFAPNAWLRITPDDRITFILDRTEMGQGVMTSHAMLVAEELRIEPERLAIELAHADSKFDNPMLGFQITGGSTSVNGSWKPLREAAAATREALRRAAAERLDVEPDALEARGGAFVHAASGRSVRYGECASDAARHYDECDGARTTPPAERTIVGTRRPRLDAPAKVDGSAVYGIDVRVPGMRTAVIVRSPAFGAKLLRFVADAARAVAGVEAVLEVPAGVAIVGESYWPVRRAAGLVKAEWSQSDADSAEERVRHAALARTGGKEVVDDGDAQDALEEAERTVEAVYHLPYLAHATMEPQNCTADVRPGRCEVWAPTQSPALARRVAARAAGLDPDQVQIYQTLVGGGFGRRLVQDYVEEAVDLSKRLGRPVQVVWSREDDLRNAYYRPATTHYVKAGVRAGKPSGWLHRIVAPSIVAEIGEQFVETRFPSMPGFLRRAAVGLYEGTVVDESAVEGADALPYALGDVRVEWHWVDAVAPVLYWRSVGHSYTAFVVETLVDELAALAGADAFAFRRELLREAPRHRAVLELAAEKAGWGTPLPAGRGRGIAVHESFGSYVAHVVEASAADGGVRVHRVIVAIDCGAVVNPDIVEAQMESAVVFAMSAALYGEITVERGGVRQSNFHDYPVVRMPEMPRVEVHLVASGAEPGGVGEPGVPPFAPALANALFAVTGRRVRELPLVRG